MNNINLNYEFINLTKENKRLLNKDNYYTINHKARRKNVIKNHLGLIFRLMLIMIVTLSLAGIIGLFTPLTSDNVKAGDDEVYYKYFHSYTIKEGDNLWKIAADYSLDGDLKSYITEVKQINHIKDIDNITTGKRIVIPYYLNYIKDDKSGELIFS